MPELQKLSIEDPFASSSSPASISPLIFNPRAYGAVGDGITNDTAALAACWNAALAAGARAKIYIPAGAYVNTVALPPILNTSSIDIEGDGGQVSVLLWNPTSGANPACVTVQPAPATSHVNGVRMSNFGIKSSNSYTKTGLRIIDVSFSRFDHLVVYLAHAGDTGIEIQGWDTSSVEDCFIYATYPIFVKKVTVGANTGTSGFDHWNFNNLFLFSFDDTQPMVSFESGTNCTALTITGSQAWVGGSGAFKFISTGFFANNSFNNIRWENGNVNSVTPVLHGYMFDIEVTSGEGIANSFHNCRGGSPGAQGFKLRSLDYTTFSDVFFDGGPWAAPFVQIDFDNTCDHLSFTNTHFGDFVNQVRTIGSALTNIHAGPGDSFTGGIVWRPNSYFVNLSNDPSIDYQGAIVFGQPIWKGIADVAVGASMALPSPGTMFAVGNGCTRLTVIATQFDLGGGTALYGMFITTYWGPQLAAGSANVVVGDTAGKLSLIYAGATNPMTIKNNLAITARIKVIID